MTAEQASLFDVRPTARTTFVPQRISSYEMFVTKLVPGAAPEKHQLKAGMQVMRLRDKKIRVVHEIDEAHRIHFEGGGRSTSVTSFFRDYEVRYGSATIGLPIAEGSVVVIVGPNGSGKTTLVHAIEKLGHTVAYAGHTPLRHWTLPPQKEDQDRIGQWLRTIFGWEYGDAHPSDGVVTAHRWFCCLLMVATPGSVVAIDDFDMYFDSRSIEQILVAIRYIVAVRRLCVFLTARDTRGLDSMNLIQVGRGRTVSVLPVEERGQTMLMWSREER